MKSLKWQILNIGAAIVITTSGCHAQSSLAPSILKLIKTHPRILVSDTEIASIKQTAVRDEFARGRFQLLRSRADRLINVPKQAYTFDSYGDLLGTAREGVDRIVTLTGMYRMTKDTRYSDRAIREMMTIAQLSNWNPPHILDTAEMTTALSIGYDWLYPILTVDQKRTIRAAITTKGISPFLDLEHAGKANWDNNIGQVVYGSETIGALATAEPDDPSSMSQAQEVLNDAGAGMAQLAKHFAPDGGFEEGPGYWNYATAYVTLYLSSLTSALGSDFGASNYPGFSETGSYRIHSIGPTLLSADFGDSDPDTSAAPQMFWMARRFNHPQYSSQEKLTEQRLIIQTSSQKQSARFDMLGLFWYALGFPSHATVGLPLYRTFSRTDQGYMRLSWSDASTWYVGFKGGDNHASHRHLDLGSFVLDAMGQRWGVDLGIDPGTYRNAGRQWWTYYRLRTEGHNTVTVGTDNQDLDAVSPVSTVQIRPASNFSIINLATTNKAKIKDWRRGISLFHDGRLLVQDEIVPSGTQDLTWHFHTQANVTISADGRSASVLQSGSALRVILLTAGQHFERSVPTTEPPQMPINGITDLQIRLSKVGASRIAVLFTSPSGSSDMEVKPLSAW
jgi:hypothetical protein